MISIFSLFLSSSLIFLLVPLPLSLIFSLVLTPSSSPFSRSLYLFFLSSSSFSQTPSYFCFSGFDSRKHLDLGGQSNLKDSCPLFVSYFFGSKNEIRVYSYLLWFKKIPSFLLLLLFDFFLGFFLQFMHFIFSAWLRSPSFLIYSSQKNFDFLFLFRLPIFIFGWCLRFLLLSRLANVQKQNSSRGEGWDGLGFSRIFPNGVGKKASAPYRVWRTRIR